MRNGRELMYNWAGVNHDEIEVSTLSLCSRHSWNLSKALKWKWTWCTEMMVDCSNFLHSVWDSRPPKDTALLDPPSIAEPCDIKSHKIQTNKEPRDEGFCIMRQWEIRKGVLHCNCLFKENVGACPRPGVYEMSRYLWSSDGSMRGHSRGVSPCWMPE